MTAIYSEWLLQEMDALIFKMAHEYVKELVPSVLRSQEIVVNQKSLEIKKSFREYIDRLKEGFNLLIRQGLLPIDSGFQEKVLYLMQRLKAEEKLNDIVQNELGLPKEILINSYAFARQMYEDKLYEDAEHILLALTFLNPGIASFWTALGHVEEKLKNIDSVVVAYLTALELNEEDLEPGMVCAQYLITNNEQAKAEQVLHRVIEKAGDRKEHATIKIRAKEMLRSMVL
jgi:hypothetical protein